MKYLPIVPVSLALMVSVSTGGTDDLGEAQTISYCHLIENPRLFNGKNEHFQTVEDLFGRWAQLSKPEMSFGPQRRSGVSLTAPGLEPKNEGLNEFNHHSD
jgi:hypothetical protein